MLDYTGGDNDEQIAGQGYLPELAGRSLQDNKKSIRQRGSAGLMDLSGKTNVGFRFAAYFGMILTMSIMPQGVSNAAASTGTLFTMT